MARVPAYHGGALQVGGGGPGSWMPLIWPSSVLSRSPSGPLRSPAPRARVEAEAVASGTVRSHFGRLARFPLRCCYYFGKCSFNSCAILSISIMSISAAGGAGRPCGCPSASRRICSTIRELSWLTPKDTSRERTVSAEINSGGTRSPLAKALRRAVAEPEDAAIPLDGDGLSKEAGKLV